MERLRLAATNQVALEAKWISRNFQQILFSLSTKWICWKFQNYNSFPKTWKWRTSEEISLHPFFILEESCNFLSYFHQRFSWRLRGNDKCFLYTSLAVTIGWSLFGSDRQICQCWYCSFPLFDFFQLFPINPFFLQIIAPFIYLFHIYCIYYQSNPNQKNDKTYNICKISHCFNCFVIWFLSNCASSSDLYQSYLFWESKFLYLSFIVVCCLTSFPFRPLNRRFLNMDDIYVKWLQIWLAMFIIYILTVFLFVFYIHDLIYDAINIVRNIVKK